MSGISLALLGSLTWYLLEMLAGALSAGSDTRVLDGVTVLLMTVQVGYFLSVMPLIRQAGRECVADIRPSLHTTNDGCSDIVDRFFAEATALPRWTWVLGAVLIVAMQESQFARFSNWASSPGANLGELWLVLTGWTTWTLAFATIALLVSGVSGIHQLGRDHVAVDLMRIDQLAVFSRYGLRLTGFVVTLMALWAVSLVIATSETALSWADNSIYAGLFMVTLYVLLAITVFLLPQLGIRSRIRSEKGRVSHLLTAMLPSAEQTLTEADANPERLAALLSSRNQIQALPEWPAGQHTHLRLMIYLLVPLLSWSAAALVEEAISRLIS